MRERNPAMATTQDRDRGRPGTATATGAGRFASQALLRRRRFARDFAPDVADWYAQGDLPRPAGSAPRLPETPLPPGLLPLPAGFELSTTTSPPRLLLAVVAARR
ncbi:hypothetical protein [Streptomyces sp. NBC_00878]|uniref:hypothetical protein n=1 Tax=Streptomyces sp. NBC_00878 TaxID=2975854 RepID=UPI00225AC07A|nr:hypothetical protein [Streptomyces sp. NBC_00878]MCX4904440.1 hypothetical protein [Streptomyces sp. NBC_00878]